MIYVRRLLTETTTAENLFPILLAINGLSGVGFMGREGYRPPARSSTDCRPKLFWPSFPWSGLVEAGFPGVSTSSTLGAAISPTRMPASPLSIGQQWFVTGRRYGPHAGAPASSPAILKPGLVSLRPPLAHKKFETSMFSDVTKSNRRDFGNERCIFSGLCANIT